MLHLHYSTTAFFWVLAGGIVMWVISGGLLCIQKMINQRQWRVTAVRAQVIPSRRLLWFQITMPCSWQIQAGQHVQLWMPRSGYRSVLHLPLFYVAHWEDCRAQIQDESSKTRRLHFAIRHRPGLTRRLALDTLSCKPNLSVHVFGPFGHTLDFGQYGTVLFVVEDIGLLRILPLLRQLVHASCNRANTVRRLEVLWNVEWNSIVEMELLTNSHAGEDERPDDQIPDHQPEHCERSNYKIWVWHSIQQLFMLDRRRNDGAGTPVPAAKSLVGKHLRYEQAKLGGFEVSPPTLYLAISRTDSSRYCN